MKALSVIEPAKSSVLSSPGGLHEANADARSYCALVDVGDDVVLYISSAHTGKPYVASYKQLLSLRQLKYRIVVVPLLSDIRKIYGETEAAGRLDEDTTNAMRFYAKAWFAQAAAANASDLVLYITSTETRIVHTVFHGEYEVTTETKAVGAQFIRAIFNGMLSSAGVDYTPEIANDGTITDSRLIPTTLWSIRVNSLPSIPQKVTFRLIYKLPARSMTDLGFTASQNHTLRQLAKQRGMILFCGSTGQGKTTSAFYFRQLVRQELPRTTFTVIGQPIEITDPNSVCIDIAGRNKEELSQNYRDAVKATLRSALMNIDMSEIRDSESASAAIEVAQTGHLTIASLHTNNTFAVVKRLKTLGANADAELVPEDIIGIVSQRLVRVLCGACAEPYPRHDWLEQGHLSSWWTPNVRRTNKLACSTCEVCAGRGVTHRRVIAEVVELDITDADGNTLAELLFIDDKHGAQQARAAWLAAGNAPLTQLALVGIQSGELDPDTTIISAKLK